MLQLQHQVEFPEKSQTTVIDYFLWNCDPAGLLQSPKTPEPRKYEKNTKSPTPGRPPENTEKIPEKYKNGPKTAIFRPFFVFLRYFFVFSGGRPGVGDFVFFSYFRDSGVFGLCSRPAGSQLWNSLAIAVTELGLFLN